MDIKILTEITTNNDQGGLYDVFEQYIQYRPDIPLSDFEIQEFEEMRIDLIMQRMYGDGETISYLTLENIDVLLYINGISNPLNLKKGLILKYPTEISNFAAFRYTEDPDSRTRNQRPLLAVPNVSTKKDKSREDYKKNNFSLPPVALPNPKAGVRKEDGIVKVGGL